MTPDEYIAKKKDLEEQLKQLDLDYLNEHGISVDTVGRLDSPDGEEVLIREPHINWNGKITVPVVYKRKKNGEWSLNNTIPYNGVYVDGKRFNWL